ncbi:MAG: AP2 domain-containing protein [Negativicutes bacterium]|nr:AP2 domain-containing protein [Negativicutes bacterium]
MIIKTRLGHEILIDDADYDKVKDYNWYVVKYYNTYYAYAHTGNTTIKIHRLIMDAKPEERYDHWDGNGLNNQRKNLRLCTNQQNAMNSRKAEGKSSRFKGVYWHKVSKMWMARIGVDYKMIYLGRYNSEIEAATAYNDKAKELFGEFAKVNEIS